MKQIMAASSGILRGRKALMQKLRAGFIRRGCKHILFEQRFEA